MAAKIFNLMKISVTGGDAVEGNRLSGKSNTGTYFICSLKDWNDFCGFFNEKKDYFLDIQKVEIYKELFIKFFFHLKDMYPDKMRHFEDICDSLLSYKNNPLLYICTRNNDVRVFMKFFDNNREVEYSLRKILYSDLSYLVIENKNGFYLVYPEVNLEKYNGFEGE